MMPAESFTQRLCDAYDLNLGFSPAVGDERATREEIYEYIDAFSVDKRPDHPTMAIAWDLQRTLGESDGRRTLLYASRRWDKEPLRARDIVFRWWEDDYEPQPWVDEYLLDVIRSWRDERDRLQHIKDGEKAWQDFDGATTLDRLKYWYEEYGYCCRDVKERFGPVKIVKSTNVVPFVPPVPFAIPPVPDLIKSSGEFVSDLVTPDFLVDGIFQRRFFYSLTAQTGVGKTTVAMRLAAHVATGQPFGSIAVEKGTVLYFAGENPTDIQMRWLGLTRSIGVDPAAVDVHFVAGAMPLSTIAQRITDEVIRKGLNPSLVVVDTAAAYFEGDDENSNTQLGEHARRIRSLTQLPGGPCVIVLCHPTKRAAEDDLIPRGGGSFLAEVDGNIALQKRDTVLLATAQGKFRGSDQWTLRFELDVVRDHPLLKDTKGRQIPTVIARPIDDFAAALIEAGGERDEDKVLMALPVQGEGVLSATEVARKLQWFVKNDPRTPSQVKVKRLLASLQAGKLVTEARNGKWCLAPKGQQEVNRLDRERQAATLQPPLPGHR